jgi:hypothetical protein
VGERARKRASERARERASERDRESERERQRERTRERARRASCIHSHIYSHFSFGNTVAVEVIAWGGGAYKETRALRRGGSISKQAASGLAPKRCIRATIDRACPQRYVKGWLVSCPLEVVLSLSLSLSPYTCINTERERE